MNTATFPLRHLPHQRTPFQLTGIALALACAFSLPQAVAQEAPVVQDAAPAAAPAAPAAAPGGDQQVVVTGSRIRGVVPVGSTVTTLGRGDIDRSGAVSTAQMLQEVPMVFNLGVSESSRGQSGGSGNITYGSSVNLRGIGPFATLTLVNGHRVVPQGTTGAGVDPSIIPMLGLQRVELVADGASAIYGSDAVTGVVNLIMRRNLEGGEGYVRYGSADAYNERQAGAVWGHQWKDGQFMMTFENDFHSALNGRDRDFFAGDLRAFGGGDFRSTQCAPGNIVIAGTSYAIPAGGVTKANAAALVAGTSNKCDNLKYADIIPRQERNSAAFTFNQDVGHGISVYADGFATRRFYTLQPTVLASNLTVPSTNAFYVRPTTAPAGSSETVAYSFLNDLPQNTATGYSKAYSATIGADMQLGAEWKAGVLYTYGKDEDLSTTYHGLNNTAIAAALASSNPATALNPFGSAPNNPAVLAAISNNLGLSPGQTVFQNVQVKADGPLMELPGGKMRMAVGYEGQKTEAEGGQTTGPATAPLTGTVKLQRIVNSAYGELLLPLVGAANRMTGIYSLDVDLAARVDRYSDVGSTHNPKVGVNWSPAKGVMVHGSYGQSFRAPGLTQIRGFTNGGRGGLFVQNYSDPTNGGALRVGVALSAANPDLKPETATTKSLGIDWEPAFGNKTKISVTYFDIVYENQVTGYLADLTVLNREAQFAGTGVITRNPSPAQVAALIAQYPVSGVLPSTWTLFIDGSNKNLGTSVAHGLDLQASTRVLTEDYGSFTLGASGTVFTKYKVALTPASPMVDQLNTIYNPQRFKGRLSVNWNNGPWSGSTFLNYQNAYDNNLSAPLQEVSSFTSVDARLAFDLSTLGSMGMLKDATLALGVTNLFDRKPPFVNVAQSNNGGGGFDPTTTNPVGRIISLSLNKRF